MNNNIPVYTIDYLKDINLREWVERSTKVSDEIYAIVKLNLFEYKQITRRQLNGALLYLDYFEQEQTIEWNNLVESVLDVCFDEGTPESGISTFTALLKPRPSRIFMKLIWCKPHKYRIISKEHKIKECLLSDIDSIIGPYSAFMHKIDPVKLETFREAYNAHRVANVGKVVDSLLNNKYIPRSKDQQWKEENTRLRVAHFLEEVEEYKQNKGQKHAKL